MGRILITSACLICNFPVQAGQDLPAWGIAVYIMPSDMIPEAKTDFNQMVAIAASHDIPIAVQWQTYHSDTGDRFVRRALLTGNENWYTAGTALPEETVMTSREAFGSFLSWVQTSAPSEKRALVTWGHGGLEKGVGYEGTGILDTQFFTFDDMRGGAADANFHCDLLVVCGCKGAVLEGVNSYARFADFFTATTMDKLKMASGLGPFNTWLGDIVEHPHWDAAAAGASWVERYRQSAGSYENTAIVMNLQQFTAPGGALDQAAWVAAAMHRLEDQDTLISLLHSIPANFQTSQNYSNLDDFLLAVAAEENGLDPSIQAAAAQARQLMEETVTHRWLGAQHANGLGLHIPWFENPPVSFPIPSEHEIAFIDRARFLETWTYEMPFINTFAYAYGDGTQQPNEQMARVVEHAFDPGTRELRVRFNQPMVRASFDPSEDLVITNAAVGLDAFSWDGYDTLILRLTELHSEPATLRLGPNIWDTHGLGMDQNNNGVAEEDPDVFEVEIPAAAVTGITFADWAQAQEIPEELRGEQDAPMGDGIPNLLKYASGMDAMTFHTANDFMAIPPQSDPSRFVVQFHRSKTAVDAVVVPQRSESLSEENWTAEGLTEEKVSEEENRETWEVSMPLESRGFIRLKVNTVSPETGN